MKEKIPLPPYKTTTKNSLLEKDKKEEKEKREKKHRQKIYHRKSHEDSHHYIDQKPAKINKYSLKIPRI